MFRRNTLLTSLLLLFLLLPALLINCSKQGKEPLLERLTAVIPQKVRGETAVAAPIDQSSVQNISNADNPLIDAEITPLSNPSFEQGMLDWADAGTPGFSIENIAIHGSKSLSLTPIGSEDLTLFRAFEMEVGKKYYVSAKVKTEGSVEGAIRVVYGASNEPESPYIQSNSDWTEVGVVFTGTTNTQDQQPSPDPNTAYVEIRLQAVPVIGDGVSKVYFDDIRVYELIDYSTYMRVKLNAPQNAQYGLSLQAFSEPGYGTVQVDYFTDTGMQTGQSSDWIDLGEMQHPDGDGEPAEWGYGGFDGSDITFMGLHIIDMSGDHDYFEYVRLTDIDLTVEFAYAADENSPLNTITETTPGGVLGYYVPQTDTPPAAYLNGFKTVAEDIQARNDHIHALNLPPVNLDKFYIEGFLDGFNSMYSDPALVAIEVNTMAQLGVSALDTRYSGLATPYREAAAQEGITQTHQTWRHFDSAVYYGYDGNFIDLNWAQLRNDINQSYDDFIQEMTTEDPAQIPLIQYNNIGDEINGIRFEGTQYNALYRQYLQEHNVTPEMLGQTAWEDVVPFANLDWWQIDAQRPANDADSSVRRRFYWTARFWNYVNAKAYAIETEITAEKLPGRTTVVNFGPPWSTDYTSYLRGAEIFEFARQKGVSMMINEDWLNTYGWRHAGIQLNAYLTDLSRSAGMTNNLEVGAYPIMGNKENIQLKMASVLGKGAKYVDLYRYGPRFAATASTHWSNNFDMVEGVAQFTRLLDKVEDILHPGSVRQPEVAIIWSQSDPLWQWWNNPEHGWERDSSYIYDRQFIYLGLLHEQIPIDFIDETGIVEENRLANYKVIYLNGTYLREDAQQALAQWVADGGTLWVDATAGMGNEYGDVTTLLDQTIGISNRVVTASDDYEFYPQSGLEQQVPLDTITLAAGGTLEAIGRKASFTLTDPDNTTILGTYSDGSPAIIEHTVGQGKVRYTGVPAGLAYGRGITRIQGQIETGYSAEKRAFITDLAHQSGVVRPVASSVPLVEADLLESDAGIGIVLANYTGETQSAVTLTIATDTEVLGVSSAKLGAVDFSQANGVVTVTIPLEIVDFLALQTAPGNATYLPTITATALNQNDVRISWEHEDALFSSYIIQRGTTPYFEVGETLGTVNGAPWQYDHAAALGNPSNNSFYRVKGILAAGGSTVSNRVGEFDFEIVGETAVSP